MALGSSRRHPSPPGDPVTRYHKEPGFTLGGASRSTKVLLTLFLLNVLGGLAVALLVFD